jgi:AcrR family transcriptional regulator
MEPRGKSRSSRADGAKTKARILEVSLPLFAELGYSGTSIRRIAAAADCNVATLAYHFRDKAGLYATVVQTLHADLSAGMPDVTAVEVGTPTELIEHFVALLWQFAKDHRVHMRLAVRHLLDQGAHPDVVMENWSEPLMGRADALVSMFRPEWPPSQRRLLVSSLQHLFVRFAIEDRAQLSAILGHPDDLDVAIRAWFAGLIGRELGLSE